MLEIFLFDLHRVPQRANSFGTLGLPAAVAGLLHEETLAGPKIQEPSRRTVRDLRQEFHPPSGEFLEPRR